MQIIERISIITNKSKITNQKSQNQKKQKINKSALALGGQLRELLGPEAMEEEWGWGRVWLGFSLRWAALLSC